MAARVAKTWQVSAILVSLGPCQNQQTMKLAAIDIGSNAIRLQVIRIIKEGERLSFKNQEYMAL